MTILQAKEKKEEYKILMVQNIVRPCNCPYNTSRFIWSIFKIFGTLISYGCVSGVVMALQHSIWNNKVKKH
jgi:hypothetical protein